MVLSIWCPTVASSCVSESNPRHVRSLIRTLTSLKVLSLENAKEKYVFLLHSPRLFVPLQTK